MIAAVPMLSRPERNMRAPDVLLGTLGPCDDGARRIADARKTVKEMPLRMPRNRTAREQGNPSAGSSVQINTLGKIEGQRTPNPESRPN